MKFPRLVFISLPGLLLGVIAFCFFAPADSARAGSVIAADKHGAYAVRYGHFSQQELTSQALAAVKKVSKHPNAAYVYYTTTTHGYGTVLRFNNAKGQQLVVGTAGCPTAKSAYDKCVASIAKMGIRKWTVATKWLEE
ncbi:MAG: hypothetical protein ABIP97_12600 [Chthoniobacterales bacterium]